MKRNLSDFKATFRRLVPCRTQFARHLRKNLKNLKYGMALTDTTHIERSQLRQNQNLEITKKATKFLGAEIGI